MFLCIFTYEAVWDRRIDGRTDGRATCVMRPIRRPHNNNNNTRNNNDNDNNNSYNCFDVIFIMSPKGRVVHFMFATTRFSVKFMPVLWKIFI